MNYTPDIIEYLEPHQIVIFGSNCEGRHGKGFAKECLERFGAKYGQAKGLQGQCYAIITKDLSKGKRSVSLDFIKLQLEELIQFSKKYPNKEFLITKIGTKNAGFSERELETILKSLQFPKNFKLPEFKNYIDQWDFLV